MLSSTELMKNARKAGLVIPAFNVPYLPMVEPVVRAVVDEDSFALVESALLEWYKFEAKSAAAVAAEYARYADADHVRLHLDHVPVLDEDGKRWDYASVIGECIELGFQSVMVDGSRLSLEENIEATRIVADMAHAGGVPCEAELGAVLGHEAGPLPPYEELFASGKGFTDLDEARRFAEETGCDWMSVAAGNIHGAISAGLKDKAKAEARLDLDHLAKLAETTGLPLVLHGGSGIKQDYVLQAIKKGIAKINVGTDIRHSYEKTLKSESSVEAAQAAVYDRTRWIIREYYGIAGDSSLIRGE